MQEGTTYIGKLTMLFSRKQGEWFALLSICKSDCFGLCSGKDFMLEAVDVLKGVSPAIRRII